LFKEYGMSWVKWKTPVYLLIIILAVVASLFIIYDFRNQTWKLKLGLDLRSGSHVVVQLKPVVNPETGKRIEITDAVVAQSKQVFEKRLNPAGQREVILQSEGRDRIIIEIPEETDIKKAEEQIRKTARLEFKEEIYNPETSKAEWKAVMDGSSIKKATATFDTQGVPEVLFELNAEGAKKFGALTERLVGKKLGIFFDKTEISAPIVREPITGGSGRISGGNMDQQECAELANYLNAGALPVDVDIIESMTVSPTLGEESLMKSLVAGFIGLTLVIIFMVIYYRVPGVLANFALIIYTIFLLASMVLGNFVLSLPGIAGLILSIGMAVDANVLIFERLKEELWSEKTLRTSVDLAFKRAFTAILDSHVTTFLCALILFWFGSTYIRGFGITLMLGTFWSLITAVVITKVMMDFTVDSEIVLEKKFYGA
jgi:preprotein translocase subunit SecD